MNHLQQSKEYCFKFQLHELVIVEQLVTYHMSARLPMNLCHLVIYHDITRRMQNFLVSPIAQIVRVLCGTKSVSRHHTIKEAILEQVTLNFLVIKT